MLLPLLLLLLLRLRQVHLDRSWLRTRAVQRLFSRSRTARLHPAVTTAIKKVSSSHRKRLLHRRRRQEGKVKDLAGERVPAARTAGRRR